jgi:ABC-2 type transport system permease protein
VLTIYLCEDEEDIRQVQRECLEKQILIQGYDMEVALCSGRPGEILEAVKAAPGRGIYFLDVELKENHTLRALMTSSITGVQYFIGSILIPFVMLMAVNYIVLFISGISLDIVPWVPFFLVSMVVSLTSCVLGMIVGICAKNQMNANLISYPFLMVFMMVPVFGNLSEGLHKISAFLFTGVMTGMTERLAAGEKYVMSPLDMVVLFGELAVSVLVFLMLYKRNGYEKD